MAVLSGCGGAQRTLGELAFPVPQTTAVAGIDPHYPGLVPRAPYDGPYPGTHRFRIEPADYPVEVGDIGPVDRSLGRPQQPFLCMTGPAGLGQPVVDNTAGFGVPVYAEKDGRRTTEVVGYSQDCLVPTRAEYFYVRSGSDELLPLAESARLPADVRTISPGGEATPFVVRVERGTLNRFIYVVAALVDPNDLAREDALRRPSAALWNRYLIYQFGGGINIGKNQGTAPLERVLGWRLNDLAKGYAIVFSTGTETGTHYNMRVAGNTAAMVKRQFVASYGEPVATIGMGASGGAAMQYVLAETSPGLLDALIPVYSYPDVATQTIWALDCELLEYYFDVTARAARRWRDVAERSAVEGVAADADRRNVFYAADSMFRFASFRWPVYDRGATACAVGWRPAIQLVDNPLGFHMKHQYSAEVWAASRWSHWHDLMRVYGVGPDGYAYRTFDNVGVQYGLGALKDGRLSRAEFLHLNAYVGGWKKPALQSEPRYYVFQDDPDAARFSMWNEHNMTLTSAPAATLADIDAALTTGREVVVPARRTVGHVQSMRAAYLAGQVFLGTVDPELPILDVRHYLDPDLDIHHSFASLSARSRLIAGRGDRGGQRIWVAESPVGQSGWFGGIDVEAGAVELNRLLDRAVDTVRRWLQTGKAPEDACFDARLTRLAQGPGVWDGAWNGAPDGACMTHFPAYRSTRDAAGAPGAGDLFKCHLQTVEQAVASGVYAPVDAQPMLPLLRTIFPDGVCDYSRGDVARPSAARLGIDGNTGNRQGG